MPPQNPLNVIKETTPQIKSLEDQISKYQSNLNASPTASSSLTDPTFKDLNAEVQQKALDTKLRALQKKNLTAAWYGADTGSTSADQGNTPGIISKALNTLQMPLQSVVKGIKTAIGDKTDVPNQEFIDLLAQHGVKGPIGSVLGFTADIMFDPVNWLTMGTGALIPRLGTGLVKGGIEGGIEGAAKGFTTGLTSSLGRKAAFVASHTPFAGGAESSFAKMLSEKAALAAENYKIITKTDPAQYFATAGIGRGMSSGVGVGDVTRAVMSRLPYGDDLYKSMYYNSREWLDNAMNLDKIHKAKALTATESLSGARSTTALEAAREAESFEAGAKIAKPNPEILSSFPKGREREVASDALDKIAEQRKWMNDNPDKVLSLNHEQNTDRLLQDLVETDQLRVILSPSVSEFGSLGGPTGIKWYDDLVTWGNGVKMKVGSKEIAPIKVFSDTYSSIIQGAFKPFHTILSPTTWAMNVLSALPMYMMMGGENALGFMNDYRRIYMGLSGIDARVNVVDNLLGQAKTVGKVWEKDVAANAARAADVRGYVEKFGDTTRDSLGVGQAYLFGHEDLGQLVKKGISSNEYAEELVAKGITSEKDIYNYIEADIVAGKKEFQDAMRSGNISGKPKVSLGDKIKGIFGSVSKGPKAGTPSSVSESLISRAKSGRSLADDFPTGFSNTEVAGQTVRDFRDQPELLQKADAFIKAKAEAGSKPFKIFQSLMDNARAGYEHQDQAFRMAVINQLINHGITENGLKVMTRFVNMRTPETQIISTYTLNGQKMYRVSMDYAMEVAHEAAINYGAMPAAIKMLRSMNVVGAPFASFGYGMATKTVQSLAYNPSFFNKVSYGIQAASGGKTPLEKSALDSKYYSWYNQPSMLRVPDTLNFFSQYPLYLNLSNALPYYSLNIFQPSNRSYSSVLPDTVVKTLDALPVLKDPVGQVLFDNFILPMIISNTDRPISSVGSPLYPINATAADKAFYAGRTLADALTPAVASVGGLFLPSEYAKYYPGYRTRKFAYGKDERNQLGIPGSESSSSRAIRNLLGYLGIPIEQADTTYAAAQVKKGKSP